MELWEWLILWVGIASFIGLYGWVVWKDVLSAEPAKERRADRHGH